MATIDVSTIEGYAEMSAEDKLAALEGYEIPTPDYTGYVKKEQFDKTASEAAEWKRKHNALLSEDEKNKLQQSEELEALRTQLAEVTRKNTLAEYANTLIGLGFDEKLANSTAASIADGNTKDLFAGLTKFKEKVIKELNTEQMKNVPTPPAGKGTEGEMTAEKLRAMSPADRYAFSRDNPEEYKKIYGV